MKIAIEYLQHKKEEYEGLKTHVENLKNNGTYRTNEEREGAEKLLAKYRKVILDFDEAIQKLMS
jgi:hypothetical protein